MNSPINTTKKNIAPEKNGNPKLVTKPISNEDANAIDPGITPS